MYLKKSREFWILPQWCKTAAFSDDDRLIFLGAAIGCKRQPHKEAFIPYRFA